MREQNIAALSGVGREAQIGERDMLGQHFGTAVAQPGDGWLALEIDGHRLAQHQPVSPRVEAQAAGADRARRGGVCDRAVQQVAGARRV